MSNDKLAFMIGLLGSIHCIGMCGPLAFAVPSFSRGWLLLFADKLSYQLGRIVAYCILGVIMGLIGRQVLLLGFQQGLSLFSGALILLAACSRIFKLSLLKSSPAFLLRPFNKLFSYALKHQAGHLIIGIVNGFLPCGFVYLALAGAVNTGSVATSVSYMFWFGTGTVPLMLAATVSVGFMSNLLRKRINTIIPFMMLILGFWFILRGLELNIPYLSPARSQTEVTNCN